MEAKNHTILQYEDTDRRPVNTELFAKKEDLLWVSRFDSKELHHRETVCPIMPENFLKEYGGIQDENVLSIKAIFEKTQEKTNENNRMKREWVEKQRRYAANALFNPLLRRRNNRRGHF